VGVTDLSPSIAIDRPLLPKLEEIDRYRSPSIKKTSLCFEKTFYYRSSSIEIFTGT
jgi:hypothetical protein